VGKKISLKNVGPDEAGALNSLHQFLAWE